MHARSTPVSGSSTVRPAPLVATSSSPAPMSAAEQQRRYALRSSLAANNGTLMALFDTMSGDDAAAAAVPPTPSLPSTSSSPSLPPGLMLPMAHANGAKPLATTATDLLGASTSSSTSSSSSDGGNVLNRLQQQQQQQQTKGSLLEMFDRLVVVPADELLGAHSGVMGAGETSIGVVLTSSGRVRRRSAPDDDAVPDNAALFEHSVSTLLESDDVDDAATAPIDHRSTNAAPSVVGFAGDNFSTSTTTTTTTTTTTSTNNNNYISRISNNYADDREAFSRWGSSVLPSQSSTMPMTMTPNSGGSAISTSSGDSSSGGGASNVRPLTRTLSSPAAAPSRSQSLVGSSALFAPKLVVSTSSTMLTSASPLRAVPHRGGTPPSALAAPLSFDSHMAALAQASNNDARRTSGDEHESESDDVSPLETDANGVRIKRRRPGKRQREVVFRISSSQLAKSSRF
jgi:hypothetical protein